MTKTFTCKELGGICDEKFSGETFVEVITSASKHMMGDEEHKSRIMDLERATGETKEQWMQRMQREFDEKIED